MIHQQHHQYLEPKSNEEYDAIEWNMFKNTMNSFPGLTWEFSQLSTLVDFMDMTITIIDQNHIETTLFKEKRNLHLYIPPTPPTPLGYSLELSTAPCLPIALTIMINKFIQRFF